mmetsp:Transcript_19696/g.40991  ORF Transcript_19696/g.40991 Transcript_19696/m.40991 type:complete len:101 (+) Transcript_19696:361-663(+)
MSHNMVDYGTMHVLAQLPFDASQVQVLKAMTEIENLQRPVRRPEKSCLNERHKDIKYKLEGPPSKVRVQQPWEKSFVLLQVSIGQNQMAPLEDYTVSSLQ